MFREEDTRVSSSIITLETMKRLLYLFLLLSCSATAKDISEYYTMRTRTHDRLFFILPIEITNIERNIEPAKFDVTYVTTEEDATINITIYTDKAVKTDSIIFQGSGVHYISKQFETFYIEREKNKGWAHRYSCRIPFVDILHLYESPMAWKLCVYAKGQVFEYSQEKRMWKKEQKRMKEILATVQLNQEVLVQEQ